MHDHKTNKGVIKRDNVSDLTRKELEEAIAKCDGGQTGSISIKDLKVIILNTNCK